MKKKLFAVLLIISMLMCPQKAVAEARVSPVFADSVLGESQAEQPAASEPVGQSTEPIAETAATPDLGLTAASALLMEPVTGTVIYEKDADLQRSPASVTKVMTLLLIFDALEAGKISLQDEVTTSAHAKSMGGSQVFLEEGEKQTVETLIKCIVVASGNDASVTMAEYISGSETEFVNQMNARAAGLGMEHTHFVDCCGLTDDEAHLTTARDIALMSRELVNRYPQIHTYATIWMENITHVTAQGTKEFGLANTNKLLKAYDGCNGLKTGFTNRAMYCISATAERNGVSMLAVVMGAADIKTRSAEAAAMLNYGFANCKLYRDDAPPALSEAPVLSGVRETVHCRYGKPFSYLSTSGENFDGITKEMVWQEVPEAPVQEGDVLGALIYRLGEQEIGRREIVAAETVERAAFGDYLVRVLDRFLAL